MWRKGKHRCHGQILRGQRNVNSGRKKRKGQNQSGPFWPLGTKDKKERAKATQMLTAKGQGPQNVSLQKAKGNNTVHCKGAGQQHSSLQKGKGHKYFHCRRARTTKCFIAAGRATTFLHCRRQRATTIFTARGQGPQ